MTLVVPVLSVVAVVIVVVIVFTVVFLLINHSSSTNTVIHAYLRSGAVHCAYPAHSDL